MAEQTQAPLRDKHFSHSTLFIPGCVLLVDVASIVISGVVCYLFADIYNPVTLEYYMFAIAFVCIVVVLLLQRGQLYEVFAIMRPLSRSDDIIVSFLTTYLFFLGTTFSLRSFDIYHVDWLYSFGLSAFALLLLSRFLIAYSLRRLSVRGVLGRSLVVLGGGRQAREFLNRIATIKPYFATVRGLYHQDHDQLEAKIEGVPVLGGLEDLFDAARQGRIDDVIVAMPWNADQRLIAAVERLKELPVNVYLSSDLVGYHLAFRPVLGNFSQLPLFEVVQRPISGWNSLIKRVEDYVLASLALILLSPLLGLVALAIRLDSPGPVLFRQPRLGFNNQVFSILKFRSMRDRAGHEDQVQQATKGDARVTRVGRFIRATSIDELPQLLNVLNGSMSLVGPRPHALNHNEEFAVQVRGYFARHKVKPGITGWAQVNGLRGETDTLDKIKNRVEYDRYYAENWSLLFDIRILVMTVLVVLFQKNAY
ncbi:MAG: undecaprenyl-phosphate glucose phosphotransferase [Rhodospirillales bacterium]